MDLKKINELIDLDYVQKTLLELVSIPSVNPPGPGRREGGPVSGAN